MKILIHSVKSEEIDGKIIRLMAIIYDNLLCDVLQLVHFLKGLGIVRMQFKKALLRIIKVTVVLALLLEKN